MNVRLTVSCTICVAFIGQIVADSAPTKPTIHQIDETHRRLTVYWHEPKHWHGDKSLYNITVAYSAPTYFVPPGCDAPVSLFIFITDCTRTRYRLDPLEFATRYKISVSAQSSGGWSKPDVFPYTTVDGSPEPVEKLKCNLTTGGAKRTRLVARWKTPCKANSKSLKYVIEVCRRRSGKAVASRTSCESSEATPSNAPYSTWSTKHVAANAKYELKIYASISNRVSTAVTCLVPH